MGLDLYASIYRNRIFITPEMEAKFNKSFGHKSTFRGTSFETVISSITGESLYYVYSATDMYERLNKFIIENKEKIEDGYPEKEEIDIRDYIDDYTLCLSGKEYTYKIYIDQLYGIRDFFKVCHENKLYVKSDH